MRLFRKKTFIGTTGDVKPSLPDNRDYLLSSYMPEIKRYPQEMPRLFDLDIMNQGQEPSCVGFSLAGMKQYNELRERERHVFDGSWIYRECKKIDGIPNFPGTYLRTGLSVLKNVGAKADSDPSKYRIASYAKVDDLSFEGLKKAIALYGVVLAGFTGTNEGWRQETIRAPRAGESTWGHAVFLTSYNKNYLIGQNSWGEQAHNKGLFNVPSNYMPFEAWVILLDKVNVSRAEKETGWVAQNWLDSNGRTTANLNVRERPTTSAKILKTLPRGTQTEHAGSANVSANGFWWREITVYSKQ